jgi:hypothetical protein
LGPRIMTPEQRIRQNAEYCRQLHEAVYAPENDRKRQMVATRRRNQLLKRRQQQQGDQ